MRAANFGCISHHGKRKPEGFGQSQELEETTGGQGC